MCVLDHAVISLNGIPVVQQRTDLIYHQSIMYIFLLQSELKLDHASACLSCKTLSPALTSFQFWIKLLFFFIDYLNNHLDMYACLSILTLVYTLFKIFTHIVHCVHRLFVVFVLVKNLLISNCRFLTVY